MKIRTYERWLTASLALIAASCASHSPSSSETTASTSGGGSSGSGGAGTGDDGGSLGDDGGTVQSRTATLNDVSFANYDRKGSTLLLTMDGTDSASQTTEAVVKVVDSKGKPVVAFDTNWDGVADSAQTRFHFDSSTLGQSAFTGTITIPGVYALAPTIASAIVELSDINGAVTSTLTAPLTLQPVSQQGDACDPSCVANRCADGLTCNSKQLCAAGIAPTISQVAYYNGATPSQLFLVNDPDENLASLTVKYLNASGNQIAVDLSSDDAGAASSGFTINAQRSYGETFFVENYPTAGFPSMVPQISVSPTDSDGRTGPAVTASATAPLYKGAGSDCDPYGFALCGSGTACAPGVVGASNKCTATSSLLKPACSGAAAITMTGVLGAWGQAAGPSLFDPPAGCSIPTAVNRPESILSLSLSDDANTVTLSTATPETDFNTIVYLLPSCTPLPASQTDVGAADAGTKDAGGDSGTAGALGCNDDDPNNGYASTLTLNNVPAGNYWVIVDSVTSKGGTYGLTISVQ